MGNSICDRFQTDDVVCPAKLRSNILTTGAVDTIDRNPSSTTAKESLHGTAFSLFQQAEIDNLGTDREGIFINENLKRDKIKP
ncbi:hypothetical protein DPMN_152571 [Dreissena polymorpha]|uniref:Uncharacterized protein n=1 Tax=Dreissena polymorpha TaxID=45954 RepID=A0A9D4J8G9_DREPO|nr:hypothetical protein DPMN_152571 [Dreissena polymorpha]